MQAITNKQITKIWAASREVGMDDVTLHDLVRLSTGKESIRSLSKTEGIVVIDALVGMGASNGKQRRPRREKQVQRLPASVPMLRSAAQEAKIKSLVEALGWNPERLKKLTLRVIKHEQIRTGDEAAKMIEALKNINAREQKRRMAERVDAW